MIIFLTLLLIISVICNIMLWFCLKQALNVTYYLENSILKLETWIEDFKKLIENAYLGLKSVDGSGMFENDDSVGFLFKEMLNIISTCNARINEYNNETNNEPEEYGNNNTEQKQTSDN